jgi:hypothetical protein
MSGNMMAHVSVANARRDDAIRRTKRQIDHIEGELRRSNGGLGANGQRVDYLVEREAILRESRDQLQAEIARMNHLSDADLVAEFVPAVAQFEKAKDAPPPADFRDSLQRGGMVPQRVDVQHSPPPVRHEGPAGGQIPWTNAAGQAVPGWVPGETHCPDNSQYLRP